MSNELDDRVSAKLLNVQRKAIAFFAYKLISTYMEMNPIYAQKCRGDTPLIMASRVGHVSVVRCLLKLRKTAFGVECVQKFMWTSNRKKETAFDVAVEKGHVDVAKLLLENLSLECLVSRKNHEGRPLISMLNPKHDELILDILEKATNAVMHPLAITSITIHEEDLREESLQECLSNIMDPQWYLQSHIEAIRTFDFGKVTPNKNTILHLASKIGHVKYVLEILDRDHHLLYRRRNSEGETPAYVAAREGHLDILIIMINYFRTKNDDIESLVTRSIDNHNALHIAIQNHHVGVVFWLIKEVPRLANLVNDLKESPIYLVAERRYYHILKHMLTKCETKSFEGPKDKTALHAAAISGSRECITYLLREKIDQKIQDAHGWTPFRYAVHHNHASATAELVDANPSIVNEIMKEDDINTFAIHIAASRGYCETLKVLMSHCPGCSELLDGKGKNIFHVAVENKQTEVIKLIYGDESYTSLVNQKDIDGNTPAHLLLMASDDFKMMDLAIDTRFNINVLNNENLTPLEIASSHDKRKRLLEGIAMSRKLNDKAKEKRAKEDSKLVENFLIVATLIATASFAAAFTVPGGFNGNEGSKQGMPILLRKAAFQAFMVTNTIAFSLSVTVLFIRLWNLLEDGDDDEESIHAVAAQMSVFITYAMIAMTIAFATGIYVVLTPYLGLAIFLCALPILVPLFGPDYIGIAIPDGYLVVRDRKKRL